MISLADFRCFQVLSASRDLKNKLYSERKAFQGIGSHLFQRAFQFSACYLLQTLRHNVHAEKEKCQSAAKAAGGDAGSLDDKYQCGLCIFPLDFSGILCYNLIR